MKLKITLKG